MHSPHPAPTTPPEAGPPAGPVRTGSVLVGLFAVLLFLVTIAWSPLIAFDRSVADGLHVWAVEDPGLVRVNRVLSDWVWDPWTMRALIAVAVVWLWWRSERLLAVWVAATSAVGTFLQQGLKSAVGRERPEWPDPVDSAHFSAFPSGHAMTAMVTCVTVLWLLRRHGVEGQWWLWAVVVAVLSVVGVGLTRLYLGVHWPTDVLGGWLLGAGWVAFSVTAYERTVLSRQH
ncbi:phosphatase PAP2 family protein [Streptomyces sp. NPDC006475]|uniref:phosphatase PAP2 family protein n=1 Tax=Streptomyces sp. NPDC006475 TaxID=3155719 RepID=UPI0033BDA780